MSHTNNEPFDLGIEVTDFSGVNLFEQFQKGQASGEPPKPIELNQPAESTTPPKKPANADSPPTEPAPKNPTIDPLAILEMAKKSVIDPEGNTDPGDDPNDKSGKQTPGKTVIAEGIYATLYEHFTEALGYEKMTEEEGFDGSEEKFIEFQEKNLTSKAEAIAEEMIVDAFADQKENENLAKDFFRFMKNGGSVVDFLTTRQNDDINLEFIAAVTDDDEKEERAETVMRRYYKSTGFDDSQAEKLIATSKAAGTLITMAETHLPQFVKMNENRKAIAESAAKAQREANITEIREYNTKLLTTIDTEKQIGPFSLTPKERQTLKEYMFIPSVELNGKKVPQYIMDLEEAKKHPLFTLHQALSLKNKGIDYSKIGEAATTKTNQILKDKLEKLAASSKHEQPVAGSGNNRPQRATADSLIDFDNISFV